MICFIAKTFSGVLKYSGLQTMVVFVFGILVCFGFFLGGMEGSDRGRGRECRCPQYIRFLLKKFLSHAL